ncbi:response regulator [Clostridium sp. JN-9]|mgnify:CR=1 FL=1|uniref:response regulator n=1 Tax=Clostridium sp. JN-9 TaxID=2507159 RepID=UPI000FFE002B|nr:response regulator [Clostridium sp. JN-9]QAT39227.1 response regulator [Clostridium sp. JN-9]
MIKVMIIEDDPMVREINSKFLNKVDGFTLYKAVSNLTEAKKYILARKPQLILLDVFLPNENGIDLLKWIRKEELLIDVILITADKTLERVQQAFRYGVIDYLIKPFTFERFKEALFQYKDRYNKFKNNQEIEQMELDKLMGTSSFTHEDNFTKGLNKYTYNSIWEEIERNSNDYFTAEGIAEETGMARVTVRKYLEYMTEEGKLERIVKYGSIGRPQHKYKRM